MKKQLKISKKKVKKILKNKPDLLSPIVDNMTTMVDNALLSNVGFVKMEEEEIIKTGLEQSMYNIGEAFDLVAAQLIVYKSNIDKLYIEANNTLIKLRDINSELIRK